MEADRLNSQQKKDLRVTEQTQTLYRQALISNLLVCVIAVIFYFILDSRVESLLPAIWLLALVITAFYRLFLWYLYSTRRQQKSMHGWLRHYLIGCGLIGLSWSLVYPLIYLHPDIVVIFSLSLLVFAIVSIGIVTLSIYLPAFIAYMYPQLIVLMASLLWYGDPTYALLSSAILIYLVVTTMFTRYLNRNTLRGIDLMSENRTLISELSDEMAHREALIEQRTAELSEKNASLRDEISERKRVEAALRQSENQLATIFGESPAGMALLDTDLRYQLINDTLAAMNGSSVEGHIGKTVYEVLPEASDIVAPLFLHILETNTPIVNTDLSGEIPSRPGEISHFTVSYFPIPDESNTPVGIGIVVIDITERKRTEEALKASEERFNLAMRGANDGLFDWDLVTNDVYFSPRWKSMLGYEDHELVNEFSVWEDLVDAEDRKCSWDMLNDYINGQRDHFSIEFKMRHKDGHWVDILSRAFLVRDATGKAVRTVGTHVDISELKNKDKKIRILSQALEQSPVLVMITDPQANIEYVNPSFELVTGYTSSEVIGQNPRIFQSGLTPHKRYQDLWAALTAKKSWSGEIQNCKKNGEIYWEYAHIAPVVDDHDNVTHYLSVKEDITQQKIQQEKILQQAQYDALTGLPNRMLAMDRLTQLLKESNRTQKKGAVLFLDLDGFKRVNDSLGHESGDRLLVQAAERLTGAVREDDTVCRLGGDEFIILLKGLAQASEAQYVAETLLSCFKEIFIIDERELIVTASIGISVFPEDGNTPVELLRNADTAMYHSKEQGRNTYNYYTESMNRDVTRRLAVEEQLNSALERSEFTVVFQPLIDLNSHRICGAEALLRWHNPVLGQVTPDEFIPIAEQSGSIFEIGNFVLSQALQWTEEWHSRLKTRFTIAVNLSPSQFRNPSLVPSIKKQLIDHQLPADMLELEITEGVLLSGYSYINTTLSELNSLGVSVSMDDFGTGYSSLSYLRSYPFNTLKIDRSFIRDITLDKADFELINAAIAMGHGLGLKVIAEGVETDAQLDMLRRLGCDVAQGYLFSKPVPAEQFAELLQQEFAPRS